MNTSRRRNIVRTGIAILFIGAGLVHFTHASVFEKLVPDALKDYRGSINALTGVLTFAMGVAFLMPRLRAVARWSAIALLVGTLPAAVGQVIHPAAIESVGLTPSLAAIRVLVQLLMIALIWWATNPNGPDQAKA